MGVKENITETVNLDCNPHPLAILAHEELLLDHEVRHAAWEGHPHLTR